MNYETTPEMEVALAAYFDNKGLVTVPNVSWGLIHYEADLVVLKKSGYAWEIEIKVSKADLKKDLEKRHKHNSRWLRELHFAIPEKLQQHMELIPVHAGVLVVDKRGVVHPYRRAAANTQAIKLDFEKQFQLARLGALRIWPLKRKVMHHGHAEALLDAAQNVIAIANPELKGEIVTAMLEYEELLLATPRDAKHQHRSRIRALTKAERTARTERDRLVNNMHKLKTKLILCGCDNSHCTEILHSETCPMGVVHEIRTILAQKGES